MPSRPVIVDLLRVAATLFRIQICSVSEWVSEYWQESACGDRGEVISSLCDRWSLSSGWEGRPPLTLSLPRLRETSLQVLGTTLIQTGPSSHPSRSQYDNPAFSPPSSPFLCFRVFPSPFTSQLQISFLPTPSRWSRESSGTNRGQPWVINYCTVLKINVPLLRVHVVMYGESKRNWHCQRGSGHNLDWNHWAETKACWPLGAAADPRWIFHQAGSR